MPQIGNQIGYELRSYAGLYNQLTQTVVPLNWIINNTVTQINGDTIEWDYFVAPDVDFSTHDDYPSGTGSCDGATKECLGTNKITHTLKKHYNKLYPLKSCRISNMAATADLQGLTEQGLLDSMVASIEVKYAKGLSKKLVNDLVATYSSIVDFTPSAGAVSVLDVIEESAVNLENLHEMDRSAQTLIASYTVSSELRKLNYDCCELTTAFVPEKQNKLGFERQIKVPDAWLLDVANTVQYGFVNYVRALYTYYENCRIAQTVNLTNELDGYVGYHKEAYYGAFLDETVSQIPETNGVAGNKVVQLAP